MNRRIICIILALAAVCGGASAQPKEGGRCPAPIYARDFSKMDAAGNMIPGEAVSIFTPYNPLELE